MKVTSLALNYVSRGSSILRPIPVASGHLLRVDLRYYAPQDKDLADWINIWEEFAFDPTFALLMTKDQVNFAIKAAELFPNQETVEKRIESRIVEHKGGRYVYPDDSGRVHEFLQAGTYTVDLEFNVRTTFATGKGKRNSLSDLSVIRFNATHLDASKLVQLQQELVTAAPVVEYRYFLTRALSTIQDKGVFKQVYGGLYYQLRGLKKAKDVLGKNTKATDLDLFFENLFIGNIKAGLTQEKLFEKARSDQRTVAFRSDITGKPREITSFHTPAQTVGGSWGAITGDTADGNIDFGDRAFSNLLNPRRDAREAIFPTATGMNIFAIFNGNGDLVEEVPASQDGQAIASDSTIPSPYTKRLQPAIGCIRCHGPFDGWQPLPADLLKLTAGKLDIFGDLSLGRKAFSADAIDRLTALTADDITINIQRARDDVARVTLKATGPWKESATQADIAKIAAQAIADAYHDYNYTLVDAKKALQELGVDVVPEKAVEVYNELMAIEMVMGDGSFYLENPAITAIGRGISVLRSDFALAYHEMEVRLHKNLKRLEKK